MITSRAFSLTMYTAATMKSPRDPRKHRSVHQRSKEGRQRRELQDWLRRLVDAPGGRISGFNVSGAHVWADQEHLLERQGQRMPVEDGYIAATPRRYGLPIVTGNDKDFRRPGLKVFNPFKELPPG
jgi:predicted nucleic acid-binding protein